MNISNLGEFRLIQKLSKIVPCQPSTIRGIGDDAAVLPFKKDKYLLFTTDMLIEGAHFLKSMGAQRIGRKALACSISDIAAMGGVPTNAVVSVGLPKHTSVKFVTDLYKGLSQIAKEFRVSIVGGDTTQADQLIINIALLGQVTKKYLVTRNGAKPGDWIFVSGPLGGSLKSGRHLTFTPRVAMAQFLVKQYRPSAMMDISDGLAGDLNHILTASKTGAKLWEEAIPCYQGVTLPQALSDGEDFELLFTLPEKVAERLMHWQFKQKRFYFYPVGVMTGNPKQKINAQSYTHF